MSPCISKQENPKRKKASFWHLFLFLEPWSISLCSFLDILLVYYVMLGDLI